MKFNPPERLDNGLEVIINSQPHLHYVGVAVGVKYGSVYEDMRINGSAHFLEHMLFEGTKTKGPREIDKLMRENGFDQNAFTGEELTAYYVLASRKNPENAVAFLADIMQNSILDPTEVENQRGAVVNELLGRQDNPRVFLQDLSQPIIFEGQAAGRLGAGTPETVSKITRDELMEIYKKNYIPQNMVLSIYGGIKPEDAMQLAKKHFGDFNRPYRKIEIPDSEGPSEAKSVVLERPGISQIKYGLCFGFPGSRRILPSNPKDFVSIDLLVDFLDHKIKDMVYEKVGVSEVTDVDCRLGRTYGVVYISAKSRSPKRLSRVQDIIASELDKVRTGDIDAEDFDRVRAKYLGKKEMDLDNALESAMDSAIWQTLHGKQLYDTYQLARGLSAEDLTRVANTYLDKKKSVSLTLKPEAK